ncbi:MAG: hypothetical protein KAS32_16800 [Candidatus Peribacteraceae bacterium]|nr:hypothetical protein [Candidatus Peribacteraceae bacterium]
MKKGWENILTNPDARCIKTGALRHNIVWDTKIGEVYRNTLTKIGKKLFAIGRRCFKMSTGRCSWCGANCGFDSSISSKGKRCSGGVKNCVDMPDV